MPNKSAVIEGYLLSRIHQHHKQVEYMQQMYYVLCSFNTYKGLESVKKKYKNKKGHGYAEL